MQLQFPYVSLRLQARSAHTSGKRNGRHLIAAHRQDVGPPFLSMCGKNLFESRKFFETVFPDDEVQCAKCWYQYDLETRNLRHKAIREEYLDVWRADQVDPEQRYCDPTIADAEQTTTLTTPALPIVLPRFIAADEHNDPIRPPEPEPPADEAESKDEAYLKWWRGES